MQCSLCHTLWVWFDFFTMRWLMYRSSSHNTQFLEQKEIVLVDITLLEALQWHLKISLEQQGIALSKSKCPKRKTLFRVKSLLVESMLGGESQYVGWERRVHSLREAGKSLQYWWWIAGRLDKVLAGIDWWIGSGWLCRTVLSNTRFGWFWQMIAKHWTVQQAPLILRI